MKTIILSFTVNHNTVSGYYLAVANALAEAGHRVVILADKHEAHPFYVHKDIRILRWPSSRPTRFADFLFAIKIFLKYRPSVVVSMFGSVNVSLLASFLTGIRRRLVWSHTLSTAFNDHPKLVARRSRMLRFATEVIANSQATRADLIDHFSVPASEITIFPNALENPGIDPKPVPYKLIFVGRLLPEKGIDLLLEAMPMVISAFPQTRLEIIGGKIGMGKIKHYSAICEDYGILDHVDFVGMQPRHEVLARLSTATLSVMPSFGEGFGLVIIESFAVSTPVIGTNSTAIREIIRDGVDGMLFEAGNASALAQSINTVLGDPELRQKMAVNCKERFLAEYHIDKVAAAVARHLVQ